MEQSRNQLQVVIAYTEGCGHTPSTRDLLLEVSQEIAVPVALTMVKVTTPEDAVRFRLHGSPTMLVNGRDIDPAMRTRTDYGFT